MVASAAIVGGAVIGAGASIYGGKQASKAAERGAASAAEAQIVSTEMQIAELARQFDYQQELLKPLIERQYATGQAYTDLLGVAGPQQRPQFDGARGPGVSDDYVSPTNAIRMRGGGDVAAAPRDTAASKADYVKQLQAELGQVPVQSRRYFQLQDEIREVRGQPAARGWEYRTGTGEAPPAEAGIIEGDLDSGMPRAPGATQFRRDETGAFVDPNLDPTRLADVARLPEQIQNTLLAPTSQRDDAYARHIRENPLAARTAAEDPRVRRAEDVTMTGMRGDVRAAEGAAGTGVYGEDFQTSPGYAFAIEEMNRALDRRSSAGGNYGGAAIIEAQRRAKGEADQEYYRWAQGRERDLGRLAQAESYDIGRGDTFAASDISRGDVALTGYEGQRTTDLARGDQAYQDWQRRREGDVTRMDVSTGELDRLTATDQSRQDRAYYNYLNLLSGAAGFGNPTAQGVQSSQVTGGAVAGAYRGEGNALSSIYGQQGINEANIQYQTAANVNNAIQAGLQNWMTRGASTPGPLGGVSGPNPPSMGSTVVDNTQAYY